MTYIQSTGGSGGTIGALKTCNITYNYQSTILGTPETLPSSEPATAQVSYTVTSGMLPTYTGDSLNSTEYFGSVVAGCDNNGASARTLNWIVKSNSTSVASGSQSVSAGYKATLTSASLTSTYKIQVGDVIEVFLWCTESDADMELNRHGLCIVPIRIKPVNNASMLLVSSSISNTADSLTNFTNDSPLKYLYLYNGDSKFLFSTSYSPAQELFSSENSTYGVLSFSGDYSASNNVKTHASEYKYCQFYAVPTQLQWSETDIIYGDNLT